MYAPCTADGVKLTCSVVLLLSQEYPVTWEKQIYAVRPGEAVDAGADREAGRTHRRIEVPEVDEAWGGQLQSGRGDACDIGPVGRQIRNQRIGDRRSKASGQVVSGPGGETVAANRDVMEVAFANGIKSRQGLRWAVEEEPMLAAARF